VGINGVYNPASGYALDVSGDLQVQDGTVDVFYPSILRGLKVSPTRFNYNPKTPTNPDSFKIELDGANCRIYKAIVDAFYDLSACVIQNTGGTGIALKTVTTTLYLNNNGSTPRVGINTTNPLHTLDVNGSLNTNADALINGLTVGRGAGISGSQNVAVGVNTLNLNTNGFANVAVGGYSLQINSTGKQNTAVGLNTLYLNTIANDNSAFGYQALYSNTIGNANTAIGSFAGSTIVDGSNNTCIGCNAQASSSSINNEITLGDSSIATLRCQQTTITSLSDARDKKEIKPLENGLTFVEKLNPVSFIWNMRDGGKVDIPEMGFIAQDLQQVQKDTGITVPNLVYESNPDRLEASYGTLLPLLVKSVQELSIKVRVLETELNELKLRFA